MNIFFDDNAVKNQSLLNQVEAFLKEVNIVEITKNNYLSR